MNKPKLRVLEKIWIAEIECRLPAQIKSKYLKELEDENYVQKCSVVLHSSPPVNIEGWVLTHLGRLTYCMSCDDPEAEKEIQ